MTISLSLHHTVSAESRVSGANGRKWLTLTFTDAEGQMLDLTLFGGAPEALLAQLLAGSVETIQLGAYAEGRKDEAEAAQGVAA